MVFGPKCKSKFAVHRIDAESIGKCFRRQSQTRSPLEPELHWRLIQNQLLFQSKYSHALAAWYSHIHEQLQVFLPSEFDENDLRQFYINQPHPKKILRIDADANIFGHGVHFHDRYMDKCIANPKPGELLKEDAYLRLVVDCTTTGSLKAGYIVPYIKKAWSIPFIYNRCRAVFVDAPSREFLRETYNYIMNPEYDLELFYFSDDSVVVMRCSDGLAFFNGDFSKADASVTRATFAMLEESVVYDERFRPDVKGCLRQCISTVKIVNVESEHGRKERVYMKPVEPKGNSGFSFTTLINNMGQIMLFIVCAENMRTMTKIEAEGFLHNCAYFAGYQLDLEPCPTYHYITFLKTTPAMNTDGELEAIDVIGSVLRGLGSCAGDLPGLSREQKKRFGEFPDPCATLKLRAELFTSEVIRGKKHTGNHIIMDSLRGLIIEERMDERIRDSHKTFIDEHMRPTVACGGQQLGYVPVEELCVRYGVLACELEELAEQLRFAGFGEEISNPVLDKIFSRDYGLSL
jgi:hypothetical protein